MLLAQGGAALLGRQALRHVVSQVLPLAAAAEAHRMLERRHADGKIIFDVTR
jgi:NADPH:quinone reductase-like Zn-dependent oxidoreductase